MHCGHLGECYSGGGITTPPEVHDYAHRTSSRAHKAIVTLPVLLKQPCFTENLPCFTEDLHCFTEDLHCFTEDSPCFTEATLFY